MKYTFLTSMCLSLPCLVVPIVADIPSGTLLASFMHQTTGVKATALLNGHLFITCWQVFQVSLVRIVVDSRLWSEHVGIQLSGTSSQHFSDINEWRGNEELLIVGSSPVWRSIVGQSRSLPPTAGILHLQPQQAISNLLAVAYIYFSAEAYKNINNYI